MINLIGSGEPTEPAQTGIDHLMGNGSTVTGAPVLPHVVKDWYTIEEVAEILRCEPRHARRMIGEHPAGLVKQDPNQTSGRPRMLYHWMCHPELRAGHETSITEADPKQDKVRKTVSPDDLALARFRLQAVIEYRTRAKFEKPQIAREETCEAWKRRPHVTTCKVAQRLPGGHTRFRNKQVELKNFSPRSLERWDSIYREYSKLGNDAVILALVPGNKDKGRHEAEIPPAILYKVHALAVSTVRADVAKAVELVKRQWPGDFPKVSITTWRRRIMNKDPRRAFNDLGKRGIATFTRNQLPDIERDWTQLKYNERWEIDDCCMDWYAHGSDLTKILRPYAYVIIRARTRQWVAFVASECPITQAQVRALVGFAMATPDCGMPDEIQFERGATACDETLEQLLGDIGVKTHRTSMDGGRVHRDAIQDRSTGHFQGKPIIEANFRGGLHGNSWLMFAQTGPDERHTAHSNLEVIKRMAVQRAEKGEQLILPGPTDWPGIIRTILNTNNNKPHTAHPMIMDPVSGDVRHMTPNEVALQLKGESVRYMPAELLPEFYNAASVLKPTRNGIKLNNAWYGRFDAELLALKEVTVYAVPDAPEVAYIVELGRLVERYEKAGVNDASQFEGKARIKKKYLNQYQELIDNAKKSGITISQAAQAFRDPVPDRVRNAIPIPPEYMQRIKGLVAHTADHAEKKAEVERRFDTSKFGASPEAGAAPAQENGTNLRDQIFAMREELMALKDEQ